MKLVLLAASVSLLTVQPASAQSGPPLSKSDQARIDAENATQPPCEPEATGPRRSQWRYGYLSSRQCQIDMLRTLAADRDLDYREASRRTQEIVWFYQARAGRQQRWMDGASAVTVFGSAGYLASSGAGQVTQTYWGAVALVPLVAAQFNAYEPTRDLFHGGAIGASSIAIRYAKFEEAADNLRDYRRLTEGAQQRTPRCQLSQQIEAAGKWKDSRPDKKAILPDLQKLARACAEISAEEDYLDALVHATEVWRKQTPYYLARDILALDEKLVQADHDLRFTPFETFTAIAAAPFLATSNLLTGENAKKAVDAIKTQIAFDKLSLRLAAITLPAAPTVTDAGQMSLSTGALARRDISPRADDDPFQEEVNAVLDAAAEAVRQVNSARAARAFVSQWVTELRVAATADELTFEYDAAKTDIQITLKPPAPPPQPLVQTTTEKK